jgi:hypothetical protein
MDIVLKQQSSVMAYRPHMAVLSVWGGHEGILLSVACMKCMK